ncbi:PilN domain-containing protein [Massilia sp. W12]|uniref:PilN domain-containing protein n=1 Tax=Massilia sp. W12 TaxID=3126507 RepID=UPI0030CE4033
MTCAEIDFAPGHWRRRLWRSSLPGWLLLGAAGLSLLSLSLRQQALEAELAQSSAQLQRYQRQLDERSKAKPPVLKTTVTEAKAKAVNAAVAHLNLPWHELLDALEAATPPNIALLSLEPDPQRRLLRASAEAKTSQDMAAYMRKLRVAGFFDQVLLTKHEVNEQDPNRPLRFQFEARWLIGFENEDDDSQERLEDMRARKAANEPDVIGKPIKGGKP